MTKKESEYYYKKLYKDIKKICYFFSYYFRLDLKDLLSLANESFMKSAKKYTYDKILFRNYFIHNLKYDIFRFNKQCKKQKIKEDYYMILMKNEFLIKNESYLSELNFNKIDEINIKIKENIKKIVKNIINLCFSSDFQEKIKPYCTKNKKNNMNNIPKYAIQEYLIKNYGYNTYEIMQAFNAIKNLLKNGAI